MAVPPEPRPAEAVHLVLYDGVCGLCNGLVQFLLRRDRRAVFAFASLQSGVGRSIVERFGRNPADLISFYVVLDYRGDNARLLARSRAALAVMSQLGWPWKIAVLLGVVPAPILDFGYNLIARHRYRLFGRYEQCLAPRPEFRGRFVD
jgi:predicted DCC family thiol-disulfide oxidoreductase YuxK